MLPSTFKKIPFYLFCFIIVYSCCTKKKCSGIENLNEIHFYNFSEHEIDTVIIFSYQKNSSLPVDSVSVSPKKLDEFQSIIFTPKIIDFNLDYKITLEKSNKFFYITDFVLTKIECNKCAGSQDYYNNLGGYSINGQIKKESILKISNY